MTDGIVPKTSNKKAGQMTDEEKAAKREHNRLSERRKWLWAEHRGAEATRKIVVQLDAQKQQAKKTIAARRPKQALKAKDVACSRACLLEPLFPQYLFLLASILVHVSLFLAAVLGS